VVPVRGWRGRWRWRARCWWGWGRPRPARCRRGWCPRWSAVRPLSVLGPRSLHLSAEPCHGRLWHVFGFTGEGRPDHDGEVPAVLRDGPRRAAPAGSALQLQRGLLPAEIDQYGDAVRRVVARAPVFDPVGVPLGHALPRDLSR